MIYKVQDKSKTTVFQYNGQQHTGFPHSNSCDECQVLVTATPSLSEVVIKQNSVIAPLSDSSPHSLKWSY